MKSQKILNLQEKLQSIKSIKSIRTVELNFTQTNQPPGLGSPR